ncbi:MAG: prepilin-type N-terminal cleavage/methylation domain-containing protein [Nitrospira sp.]|nr:prepilin-type N-terminal cleavage/methylation domain-containing protein [bacterium]MBL7048321.1 prepilin-type N-terminal cleavage/methylation domain-containing protein [Nitrospira sp.]
MSNLLNKSKKVLNHTKGEDGFTLLELLVVVTVMAIIGGAMISSFGSQDTTAARGVATQTLAGVQDALQIYQATEGRLPSEMESLACLPYNPAYDEILYSSLTINNTATPDSATVTAAYKFGGQSDVSGIGGGLGSKLAGKFTLRALTAAEATDLSNSGITTLRYAVTAACDNDATSVDATPTVIGGTNAALGAGLLVKSDIMNHAFEDPRPDTATSWENRGRGFSAPLLAGAPAMVWNAGTDGYNNKKVGAAVNDVLVGVGIGQASDLVGKANSPFSKAPFYGQVGKDKYAHYVALINITQGGIVQAILDARGDFLDEEIAEFRGQKS